MLYFLYIPLKGTCSSFYLLSLASYGGIFHLGSYRSSCKGLHRACSAIHIPHDGCSNHRTMLRRNRNLEKFRDKKSAFLNSRLFIRCLRCCSNSPENREWTGVTIETAQCEKSVQWDRSAQSACSRTPARHRTFIRSQKWLWHKTHGRLMGFSRLRRHRLHYMLERRQLPLYKSSRSLLQCRRHKRLSRMLGNILLVLPVNTKKRNTIYTSWLWKSSQLFQSNFLIIVVSQKKGLVISFSFVCTPC